MSGLMAKTLHPACALVGYSVITAIVFTGLLASPFSMFVAVSEPKCMDGTTSTPYPFTVNALGVAAPSTGPNAPNADSVPFCNKDALYNAVQISYVSVGFLGYSTINADPFTATGSASNQLFCYAKSNGTCDSFGALGVNTIKVSINSANNGRLSITDSANFLLAGGGSSISSYNNFPITFAEALPIPNFATSNTYYMRNVNLFGSGPANPPSFQIAIDTTSLPIASFSSTTGTFTVTMPSLASCATQNNMAFGSFSNPANINSDGTLKQGSCGYCLTKEQSAGMLAVPGLCGITIALLLIIELMMCIPAARKLGFFPILVIVVSVLCIVFLIAAVASAATWHYQVASCTSQTDFTKEQFMPAPTRAAFSGYTPSSGTSMLRNSRGRGRFDFDQLPGPTAYLKPSIIPGIGAAALIVAIVLLFLFTIFFAIKTDWKAVSSSADSAAAIMTPR
jgi:hypothetical protein